jgi:hypothetical protein
MRNIELRIEREAHRGEGLAAMALYEDGSRLCALDIQYSVLRALRNPSPIALDFLVMASSVYALDKTIVRETAGRPLDARDFAVDARFGSRPLERRRP